MYFADFLPVCGLPFHSLNSGFQRAVGFFPKFFILFLPALCGFQNPVPQSGIKPGSSAVKVLSPNHWTAREFVSSQSVQLLSCVWLFAILWTAVCQASLTIHHQLPELAQTHVHRVGDAIQPSIPLSSPFLMSGSFFFFFNLLLSCMSYLCVLEIKPLLVTSFANIFSHSVVCLFVLFMDSFAV